MLQELLLYISAAFACSIIAVHLVCAVGILLNRIRDVAGSGKTASSDSYAVSVIVVAKDEEENLGSLFASLESQSIQTFQTVLVSDRSQDRTLEIMKAYQKKHGSRVIVLENTEEVENLGPKQFVLDVAVSGATGEILVFTDADCTVPPFWVENMQRYFSDPRIGVVFGQISLKREPGFFKSFQAFDQPLIHQYNSATAGL